MKQQTWRNLKICALNMSAETFEVRRGAGQAWSWPSTELVSHGAVAGGSWLHALEGRICSYTYNEARNYLSAQVVPANQTEGVKLCWCDESCRWIWDAALGVGTRWSLWLLPTQTTLGFYDYDSVMVALKMTGSRPRSSKAGPGKIEERRSFLGVGTPGWSLLLTCSWEADGKLSGLWPVLKNWDYFLLPLSVCCGRGMVFPNLILLLKKPPKTTSPTHWWETKGRGFRLRKEQFTGLSNEIRKGTVMEKILITEVYREGVIYTQNFSLQSSTWCDMMWLQPAAPHPNCSVRHASSQVETMEVQETPFPPSPAMTEDDIQ